MPRCIRGDTSRDEHAWTHEGAPLLLPAAAFAALPPLPAGPHRIAAHRAVTASGGDSDVRWALQEQTLVSLQLHCERTGAGLPSAYTGKAHPHPQPQPPTRRPASRTRHPPSPLPPALKALRTVSGVSGEWRASLGACAASWRRSPGAPRPVRGDHVSLIDLSRNSPISTIAGYCRIQLLDPASTRASTGAERHSTGAQCERGTGAE